MKKLFAIILAVAMMLSLACSAVAEAPAAIPEGRRVITFWHSMSGGNLDALNEIVSTILRMKSGSMPAIKVLMMNALLS